MKRTRRWLAWILTAILLVSLLPTAVLAEEELPAAEDPGEGEITLAETPADGEADPDAGLNRAELAGMIYENETLKALVDKTAEEKNEELDFADAALIESDYAAYKDAIYAMARAGILRGNASDGTFDPGGAAPRYVAAVIIWRLFGQVGDAETQTLFADIAKESNYAPAINYLAAMGILTKEDIVLENEDGDGCFEPNTTAQAEDVAEWIRRTVENGADKVGAEGDLTRAELAEMIYANGRLRGIIRLAAWNETALNEFADIEDCTWEQKLAIQEMAKAKILTGTGPEEFSPDGLATRAQAAVVLWRAAESRSNNEAVELPYGDLTDSWYVPALNCLYALGILEADERFRPDDTVTAAELAGWLAAYSELEETYIRTKTQLNATTRVDMLTVIYEKYEDLLPAYDSSMETAFVDIADCTEEQQQVIALFNNLKLPNDSSIVNGVRPGEDGLARFVPFAAASNAQTTALLQRVIAYIEENPKESLVTLSDADGIAAQSSSVLDDSTVDFLEKRGLMAAAATLRDNPNAPTVQEELDDWSQQLKLAPVFTPSAGMYFEAQSVAITSLIGGADIYYTTDGSEPAPEAEGATKYEGTIPISKTMTIKAVAAAGGETGPVVTAVYSIYAATGEGDGYTIENGVATVTSLEGLKNAEQNSGVYKIVVGENAQITVNESIDLTKELEVYGTLTIAGGSVLTTELVSDDPQMQYANYWENMGAFLHFTRDNGDGTTTRVRKMYGSREPALNNLSMEGYELFLVALCGGDLTLDTSMEASTVLVLLTNEDGSAGTLTIADGTVVTAREFGMPMDGSRLIVEAGGGLRISAGGGGWINGDVEFYGPAPQVPDVLEWNGEARYTHLVALWYDEGGDVNLEDHDDGIWMTPLDEYEAVFAMMVYDESTQTWGYEPIDASDPNLATGGLDYRMRESEYEQDRRMFLTGAEWHETYKITYMDGGVIYSLPVHVELPDLGFYSEPIVEEEYYINGWNFSPLRENMFYLCAREDAWFMEDTEYTLSVGDIRFDHTGEHDTDGYVTVEETGKPGVWKVTVNRPDFGMDIPVMGQKSGEDLREVISRGIWVDPAERLVYSETPLVERAEDGSVADADYDAYKGRLHDTLVLTPRSSKDVVFYLLRYDGEQTKWLCEYTGSDWIWQDDGITVEPAGDSLACTVGTRHPGTYYIGHLDGKDQDGEYIRIDGSQRGIPLTVNVTFFNGAAEVSTYEEFKMALDDPAVDSIKIVETITIPETAGSAETPLAANKPILVAANATLKLAPGAVMTSTVPSNQFYYEDSDNLWTHVANGMAAFLLWTDENYNAFRMLYGSMPENLTAVMNDTTHGSLYTAVFGGNVRLTGNVSVPQLWVMNNSSLTLAENATLTMSDSDYDKLHVEAGDLTLEAGAQLTVGGNADYGSSLSMHAGNLEIGTGAALTVNSDMYLLRPEGGDSGNLIVRDGGSLVLGENGGWVEGDAVFFGSKPTVPENLDYGGELCYTHLAACWDAERGDYSDDIYMTPRDWYDLTFSLMYYDEGSGQWTYKPVTVPESGIPAGLFYGAKYDTETALDACDAEWNTKYFITYTENEVGYCLPVYVQLPNVGYYSAPEASENTYINGWDYTPLKENVFYLCVHPDVWFMEGDPDLSLNISYHDDRDPGRDSGIICEETGTKGVWRITAEAFDFSVDIEVMRTTEEGVEVVDGRGIWIGRDNQLFYSYALLGGATLASEDKTVLYQESFREALHDTLYLEPGAGKDVVFYELGYDDHDGDGREEWVCYFKPAEWVKGGDVLVTQTDDGTFSRVTAGSSAGTFGISLRHGGEEDENGDVWPLEETYGIPLTAEVVSCTGHQFGDWMTEAEPTHTEAGVRRRACAVCGYDETGVIGPEPYDREDLPVVSSGGTETSQTVCLTNQSGETVSVQLILAVYDGNGRMCGVSTVTREELEQGGTLETTVEYSADLTAGKFVAFLLEPVTSDPLCEAQAVQ